MSTAQLRGAFTIRDFDAVRFGLPPVDTDAGENLERGR
jgi:hypothetical protein